MKKELIHYLASRFACNGSFTFHLGHRLKPLIRENKVPASPGVYIIFNKTRLLYIGHAGTVKQNGSISDQKLNARISARQEHISREAFFSERMIGLKISSIDIYWFVTMDNSHNYLPSFIELEAIQKFYDKSECLPLWNKCI